MQKVVIVLSFSYVKVNVGAKSAGLTRYSGILPMLNWSRGFCRGRWKQVCQSKRFSNQTASEDPYICRIHDLKTSHTDFQPASRQVDSHSIKQGLVVLRGILNTHREINSNGKGEVKSSNHLSAKSTKKKKKKKKKKFQGRQRAHSHQDLPAKANVEILSGPSSNNIFKLSQGRKFSLTIQVE